MIVLEDSGNSKAKDGGNKAATEDTLTSQVDVEDTAKQPSETEPVAEKSQPTTGKRKVRMPKMLEREYLLAKEASSTESHSSEVKLK